MDRERLWWSVNGERGQMPQFKASSHDYRREDNLDGVDIESINAILAQRLQARPAPGLVCSSRIPGAQLFINLKCFYFTPLMCAPQPLKSEE